MMTTHPHGVMTAHAPGVYLGLCGCDNEAAGVFVITVRDAAGPAVRAAFEDVELIVANDTMALHRSSGAQAPCTGILQRVQDRASKLQRCQGPTPRRVAEIPRFSHRPNASDEWSIFYEHLSADRGLRILVGL